jgi:CubicO group peptidase (beta-lactamase class C family)
MKADNHYFMNRRITAVLPFIILTVIVIFQLDFMAQTQNELPWQSAEFRHLNSFPVFQQKMEAEKHITVLKNSKDLLPFSSLDKKFVVLTVGDGYQEFTKTISLFTDFTEININFFEELKQDKLKIIEHADHFILSIHISENQNLNKQALDYLHKLPCHGKRTVVFFAPLDFIKESKFPHHDALVMAYENHPYILDRTAQVLFGAIPTNGKLTRDLSKTYLIGSGEELKWGGRLKFTEPEEVGIDPKKLEEIDNIARKGISAGAYPGCQIVAAVDGKIFYRKSFGNQRYEKSAPVKMEDIYDLASITKIGASTTGLMYLESKGKFDVSRKINEYIPEWVKGTKMENLELKDMLTHQAGLKPWIPFYLNVLKNNLPDPHLFNPTETAVFTRHVADDLWMREDYVDSMYMQISSQPLGEKEFKYSDLGYYFIMKIIEKQSKQELNHFLKTQLYEPMGLRTMGYNPLNCFDKSRIAPTENDIKFRKQVVQGYVHDPGAAMLGGVCGHAGLFGNATDLASLMQMFLNKGYYGGVHYLKPEVVDLYTTNPFKTNHRGIGFDKPKLEGGGTCTKLASSKSFGHSGFTGTLAWADPENQLNFVFLSNRVYPDQENRKIIDMGIRADIQRVLYESIKERKKTK